MIIGSLTTLPLVLCSIAMVVLHACLVKAKYGILQINDAMRIFWNECYSLLPVLFLLFAVYSKNISFGVDSLIMLASYLLMAISEIKFMDYWILYYRRRALDEKLSKKEIVVKLVQ